MEADAFNELLESISQAGAIRRGELMPAQPPNRADVESRVAEAQPDIVALGVRRLALFGSVRRDAAGVGSDVDFLVEFAPGEKSYDHLLDLGDLLEHSRSSGGAGHSRIPVAIPSAAHSRGRRGCPTSRVSSSGIYSPRRSSLLP